jgi:hypothetical protein
VHLLLTTVGFSTKQTEYGRRMEDLQSKAFTVYLQHTLDAASAVASVVHQRKRQLELKTVNASALWVRYCKDARSACGVFGLTAIDRAESAFHYRLKSDCSFEQINRSTADNLALKFEKSAICYCKALGRQLRGDLDCAALWSYAGLLYDQADAEKVLIRTNHATRFQLDVLCAFEAYAIEYGLPASNTKRAHHAERTRALRSEISMKYHTALAQFEVVDALYANSTVSAHNYVDEGETSASDPTEYLIRALQYTENARECDNPGEEELQALWEVCARHMRAAAADGATMGGNYRAWVRAGEGVADLAQRIAPAVRMLNALSIKNSAANLKDVGRRVSDVFHQIQESPWVRGPTGVDAQYFSSEPIKKAIEDIEHILQTASSGSVHERRDIQRFLAAADKVNVHQSPAHPHIKQCWHNAAEQMSLAIAATTVTEHKRYQQRSAVQEKLALGPLCTTAEYFIKAELAVTPNAYHLWRQAAQLLLETTVLLVESCLLQGTVEDEGDAGFTCDDAVQLQRVRRLVAAATCCEKATSDLTDVVTGALHELRRSELQLRLAVLDWDAPDSVDSLDCTALLDWCAHRPQRAVSTLPPPDWPPLSAEEQQDAQRNADERLMRAGWLCNTMARVVKVYTTAGVSGVVAAAGNHVAHSLCAFVRQIVTDTDPLADPLYSTLIDTAVDALEQGLNQMKRCNETVTDEQLLTLDSAVQLCRCAEYTAFGALYKYIQVSYSDGADETLQQGAHAKQAGQWYAAAAQAAGDGQWELHSAFTEAAKLTSEPHVNAYNDKNASRAYEKLRPAAIRAGERFAKAAEALQAGDRELYEMWLRAAQATASELKGPGWQGLRALGLLGDPEALAQAAQAHRGEADAAKRYGHGSRADAAPDSETEEAPSESTESVGQKRKREGVKDGTCVVM